MTFHVQKPANGWLEAVQKLPGGALVLAVDGVQWLKEAKEANPNVKTILRHVDDPFQVFPLDEPYEWYLNHAKKWFPKYIDETFRQHAQYVDYVKAFNEIYANSQTGAEVQARIWWEQAAATVWHEEYRSQPDYSHIRLVIGSAAIGNDMPLDIAKIAVRWDCVVSYHSYYYTVNGQQPDWEWPTLSGRFDLMDMAWTQQGYSVDWMATESGPFESAITGWRSDIVCGGSVDCYLQSIGYFLDNLLTTDAYPQGRYLGSVLFTTNPGGNWQGFNTQQPEMNKIADFVRAWYIANPPGDKPPPPPPPDEERGKPRTQYARVYNVVPDNATRDEAISIFTEGWDRSRETTGGSFDDAGIGDLDNRLARLYGIPGDKKQIYRDWYNQWYPRVVVEFGEISEADSDNSNPDNSNPEWLWPVDNPIHSINDPFDAPRSRYKGNHEGVDLFAEFQDQILASRDGDVIWASNRRRGDGAISDYGNHVVIDHGDGWISWSAHLDSYSVQEGDVVLRGDVIGLAGSTGNSTGVHLHFSVQKIGGGLSGYVIADVVDPGPLLGL